MKYNTLIKDIKKRKLWDTIIYIENADNHASIFYYRQDFEDYIKALYQNQERLVDFTLTYIRERKELHIWSRTQNIYQRIEENL
jgi:hypothetical protein